jgi:hypothetical protein
VGALPARSRVGDTSRRRVVLPLRAVARRRCVYCPAPRGFIFAPHRRRCQLWDARMYEYNNLLWITINMLLVCAAVGPRGPPYSTCAGECPNSWRSRAEP